MIGPTAFLNNKGCFKDDIMVYKVSPTKYFVVGNAVNKERDYE